MRIPLRIPMSFIVVRMKQSLCVVAAETNLEHIIKSKSGTNNDIKKPKGFRRVQQ